MIFIEDIRFKEIKNIWLLAILILAITASWPAPLQGIAGGVIGLVIFIAAYIISGKRLGEGDIKLIFSYGLIVGYDKIIILILVSCLLSLPFAVWFILRKKRSYEMPYAPFLISAFYLVWLI